jgi:hypothetical protein
MMLTGTLSGMMACALKKVSPYGRLLLQTFCNGKPIKLAGKRKL